MPQEQIEQLEERLRKVEQEITKTGGLVSSINDKLNMAIGYEARIRELENFKSKVFGYSAGVVGMGGIILFILDKIIK